jgi:hypothetical protein
LIKLVAGASNCPASMMARRKIYRSAWAIPCPLGELACLGGFGSVDAVNADRLAAYLKGVAIDDPGVPTNPISDAPADNETVAKRAIIRAMYAERTIP